MIRRSFRIGLWLGLLGGLTYAVLRLVQGGKEAPAAAGGAADSAPAPQPWKRLEVDGAPAAAAPSTPADAVAEVVAPQPRPAPVLPPTPSPEVVPEAVEVVAPITAPQPEPEAETAPVRPRPAVAPVKKEPAKKVAAKKAAPKKVLAPWVDPKGGICPKAHPVKAKLGSRIFQVPGQFAYERTLADRCYKDPKSAEKDGFRAAKR